MIRSIALVCVCALFLPGQMQLSIEDTKKMPSNCRRNGFAFLSKFGFGCCAKDFSRDTVRDRVQRKSGQKFFTCFKNQLKINASKQSVCGSSDCDAQNKKFHLFIFIYFVFKSYHNVTMVNYLDWFWNKWQNVSITFDSTVAARACVFCELWKPRPSWLVWSDPKSNLHRWISDFSAPSDANLDDLVEIKIQCFTLFDIEKWRVEGLEWPDSHVILANDQESFFSRTESVIIRSTCSAVSQ